MFFASESWPLKQVGCDNVNQLHGALIWSVPKSSKGIEESVIESKYRPNHLPQFIFNAQEESLLEYEKPKIKRCSKCILTETMPFIRFDSHGICNYCHNYTSRNQPKPLSVLETLIEPYQRVGEQIVLSHFQVGGIVVMVCILW